MSTAIPLSIQFDDDSKETASVFVTALVNNQPTKFLLDTGCATTLLVFNDFSASLPKLGTNESSGTFRRVEHDSIQIESLSVGSLQKRDMTTSRSQPETSLYNLLGMDFLSDVGISFLFQDEKIIPHHNALPEALLHDLFMDKGGIPYIDIQCGNTTAKTVWDSGAGVTLVDLKFLKENSELFEPIGASTGTDSTGQSNETPTYLMKSVTIQGHTIPSHMIVALDLAPLCAAIEHPFEILLGFSTLKHMRWYFDFKNKKWSLSK